MSIELRQAAQQALEAFDTFGEDDDFASLFALNQKMDALRTALSQPAEGGEADTGPRVLREVFALCEATEHALHDECNAHSVQDSTLFSRGRLFEAKSIRKAIGTWFQDEFCGRSFMGEPVATPPHPPASVPSVPATTKPFGFVHHFVAKDANGVIDTTWEADGCSDPMPHPTHPDKWSWSHAEPFYTHSAPPVPDISEFVHERVADLLYSIGWRSPCDAQWTGLKAALPELAAILAANKATMPKES